ncbi:hypothetical protein [Xenorhabdus szentirmaii]|uniref:hypothetical protein n=1 Tax=Xenorhabdus szentirmaii TaxID=290112 RepID=UPI0019C029B3|nr:hypothetical protein [Xenorhabdus sp. 5]
MPIYPRRHQGFRAVRSRSAPAPRPAQLNGDARAVRPVGVGRPMRYWPPHRTRRGFPAARCQCPTAGYPVAHGLPVRPGASADALS